MKSFKHFVAETVPTVHANVDGAQGGFSSSGTSALGNAGYDKRLFPAAIDDLSQDYQTPGQSGQAKWRFAGVYPVQKLSLADVDSQVAASNKFIEIMDEQNSVRIRKNFRSFMDEINK